MIIAIDFDGTCVAHDYPSVGKDIGAVPILKALIHKGHRLILHTMRDKETLEAAVKWFKDNNIPLLGVNNNPTQKRWTESPKIFAHMYIDDAALGVPLKLDEDGSITRPYVDWNRVKLALEERGIL